MTKETAEKLAIKIRESSTLMHHATGREVNIFTEKDYDSEYEVKVFEKDPDGVNSDTLINIKQYTELAIEYNLNCYVKREWRDGKGTKGNPYFLYFKI